MGQLRDRKHRHDTFFRKAREEGFVARAVYKLEDIDRRVRLFHPGGRVLDLGCRLTPGKVHKGKRMSARMGTNNYTSSDLVVVKILEEKNVVIVKGSVPGPINGVVVLKGSTKNVKKYIVPQAIKEVESKNPMKASKKGQTAAQKK